MSKTKVELDHEGFRELLTSPKITKTVEETAKRIAKTAGTGYEYDVQSGAGRAVARVYPATAAAKKDNKKNNTLLKALQS